MKALFEHRLSSDPVKARAEWLEIVEASHLLWTFITSEKRELLRSVFNTLNMEIVKRARPTSVFNFAEASIGNLFLTGYVRRQSTLTPAAEHKTEIDTFQALGYLLDRWSRQYTSFL